MHAGLQTIQWIILNYIGLLVWLFVWMIDQTRVRGRARQRGVGFGSISTEMKNSSLLLHDFFMI